MQRIQTFKEWAQTPRGKEACDMTRFPSMPKKHYPFAVAGVHEAYEAGCTAVQMTLEEPERTLTPPEAENGTPDEE